jgi:hypothetical protein
MMKIEHKLPRTLPTFIEVEPDSYASSAEATVAQWRAQKKLLRPVGDFDALPRTMGVRRTIHRMVRLADTFGIPDDVPLLPRLKALAGGNVTAISPKVLT